MNMDSLISWIDHSNPVGLRIIEQVNEITFKKLNHMFSLSKLICFFFLQSVYIEKSFYSGL